MPVHISLKVSQIIFIKNTSVMFQMFVVLENLMIGGKHWSSTILFCSMPTVGAHDLGVFETKTAKNHTLWRRTNLYIII